MAKKIILGSEGFDRNSPISNEEVKLCKEWIKKCITKRKTINEEKGSYGLKHVVEKYYKTYISNGAFIKAAIEMGFDYRQNGLNAFFNMSFVKAKKNKDSCFCKV